MIPDVPIGHFRFTLFGGAQGYLSNTESLCAANPVVDGRNRTAKTARR